MIAALEATGLGRRHGRIWALRDCSIRIRAGSIAALVGPNGAGKTTLLHLAIGLSAPSEGSVTTYGWSPRKEPEMVLPRVGFVAQDTPLYHRYSVADMVDYGRCMNRRWDGVAARDRLRRLGIPLSHRTGQLSGGQRAQVALALALAKRPELVLLDEPLASLDPLARRQFLQELMTAVASDGLTVVLSSHLVADLERICDHLVILNQGRVQVAEDIERLLRSHRILVGPHAAESATQHGLTVVRSSVGDRLSTLVVRGEIPPLPPGWREIPISLEEVAISYLANPDVSSLAAPALAEVHA